MGSDEGEGVEKLSSCLLRLVQCKRFQSGFAKYIQLENLGQAVGESLVQQEQRAY